MAEKTRLGQYTSPPSAPIRPDNQPQPTTLEVCAPYEDVHYKHYPFSMDDRRLLLFVVFTVLSEEEDYGTWARRRWWCW